MQGIAIHLNDAGMGHSFTDIRKRPMNRSLLLAGTDPFRIIFVFVLYVPLWLVNAFVLYGVAWAATWPLVGLARS